MPMFLAVLAFALSGLGTAAFIRWQRAVRMGQFIRDYGPKIHAHKQGTPTAGGVVPLAVFLTLAGVNWALTGPSPLMAFLQAAVLGFAGVGLVDDGLKFRRKRSLGLKARYKLLLQLGVCALLYALIPPHVVRVPFVGGEYPLSGWGLFLWLTLVSLATTNAFNLTDGLDGLAVGIALIASIPLGFIAYLQGEVAVLSSIVLFAAALLGFLWFNAHPAQVFLGDTGSYALGGFVAATALLLGVELLLPLIAVIPMLETLSVILQVGHFKLRRRRVFKVAPLHHHFEAAKGADYPYLLPRVEWPEAKITVRFWLVAAMFALVSLWAYPYPYPFR